MVHAMLTDRAKKRLGKTADIRTAIFSLHSRSR